MFNSLGYLEESECHASTDDQLIHLVQHIVDQLDLVSDLGSSQDGQKWSWGIVQCFVEVGQLFLQKESRSPEK